MQDLNWRFEMCLLVAEAMIAPEPALHKHQNTKCWLRAQGLLAAAGLPTDDNSLMFASVVGEAGTQVLGRARSSSCS
jgi:hypothetical protein